MQQTTIVGLPIIKIMLSWKRSAFVVFVMVMPTEWPQNFVPIVPVRHILVA